MVSKAVITTLPTVSDLTVGRDSVASSGDEFEQILYHLTHDLRASMRAFKTVPDWIIDDLESAGLTCPEPVRECLDLLKIQGDLADKLLVDLSTYSRVGRRSDKSGWQDLSTVVEAAVTAAQVPDEFQIDRSLGVIRVFAPANDLATLIRELLHNAWWHHGSDHGVIEIGASIVTARDGRNHVRLFVADDGQGVPLEHHGRIFEMLSRLRPRDEHPGSGLGLATSRKIVACLGGTLEITSASGCGARFDVLLPHPPPLSA